MSNPSESATILSKQLDATSACQRALLLLQQAPDPATTEQITEALSLAQSALAVMAHCLEQTETPASVPAEPEVAIPLPSEPLELDASLEPEEHVSSFEEKTLPVLEEVSHQPVESNNGSSTNPTEGPSAGPSLAQRLSESRLESIQSALSINDKVRFAAELAHGDMAHFRALCQTVDGAGSQDAAVSSVQLSCKHVANWEDEEEAPFQFLQLVRRVFA